MNPKPLAGAFAVLLAALAVLPGCASLAPHLLPPDVSITAVRFEGGSFARQQLQLTAHVYNPNDRAIAVDSLSADVDLDGTPFASGVTDAAFVLPAQGTYDVVLDVSADMASGLIVLAGRRSHRDLPYRVHGEVHLQRGLVRLLHFSHAGDLRL
jgi:LEA14-like dessication related protein